MLLYEITHSYQIAFRPSEIIFTKEDIYDTDDLASRLGLRSRIEHELQTVGGATTAELAEALNTTVSSVRGTLNRSKSLFAREGDNWTLKK